MATVLVVEDDPAQRRLLDVGLTRRGHAVVTAASGAEARTAAESGALDVALVDLGLPDIDGIELCRRLKVWPGCPVIVVSAEDADARIVAALETGADDYVVKPVVLDVLQARIDVQLRHARRRSGEPDDRRLDVGDVQLDPTGHVVTVDGHELTLNAQQFRLLAHLMHRVGRLVRYDELLQALGKVDSEADRQALRTAVSRLRSELGDGPRRPRITAERHAGYRLTAP